MIVAADGSGDFRKLQDAIDSIPENNLEEIKIHIKAGIYKEKLSICKPNVTLVGEGAEKTILTYGDYARKQLPDGKEMGTFGSYSAYIGGTGFTAENLTFENSAGSGEQVGQALAAHVDADRASFKNCRFLGHQDTLFTGPIPAAPGTENETDVRSYRQYYENCYIEGDVDFIFGSAMAVFYQCEIVSLNRDQEVNGYITAASTGEKENFGYVFIDCRLTGDATKDSVYLGRPWRKYAKVAFVNCWMGEHIIREGWHNWRDPEREKTVRYVEFGSSGPGNRQEERVSWAQTLTGAQVAAYTVKNVLKGTDNWNPQL